MEAWRRAIAAIILLVAMAEGAAIVLFGALALSGDELGIARAMLTLLLVPFALTTVPGLALLLRGRLLPSAFLVALSAPLMWLLWFLA